MRSLNALVWRNLRQASARTILSALAVALGAAMIVATSVASSGMRSAWTHNENTMAWVGDMIDVLASGVGIIILAAAGFVVFNAFAMAVTQRRRQIGMLRSLGMTCRQVMRLVLAEALLTGGAGTLLGLAGGPLLGRVLLATMRQTGVEVGKGQVSLTSAALAVLMGLGISLLSALLPAQRAAHVPPLAALREPSPVAEARHSTVSRWVGLAMMAGLLTYLVVAPPGEWSGKTPPWEWVMTILLWAVWLAAFGCLAPTLIVGLVQIIRGPLCRFGGAIGRLLADNLERTSYRVTLTVLAFAVGLAMTVGVGGVIAFNNDVLLAHFVAKALQQTAWFIHPFDPGSGIAQLNAFDVESLRLRTEVIEDVYRMAAGRATVGESYTVLVPEIGSPIPGFPSLIMDAADLKQPGNCTLIEGDWETVTPLLTEGCGLLISPTVAGRHHVGVGDTLTVQGTAGPVECVVAGIGAAGFAPMSVIGSGAKDAFVPAGRPPAMLSVRPLPSADTAALEADLLALPVRHSGAAWVSTPEDEINSILDTSDQLQSQFNVLLLLAEVAAALGMINTMMMSVAERQRELGLLRAVGATRRQVVTVIVGEAALMGLIGAGLGAVVGIGLGGIWALAYGGLSFSVMDLPLWQGAWQTVLPALRSGWIGIVAAPLFASAAAYPIARSILRGSAVETLQTGRQRARRRPAGRAAAKRESR